MLPIKKLYKKSESDDLRIFSQWSYETFGRVRCNHASFREGLAINVSRGFIQRIR